MGLLDNFFHRDRAGAKPAAAGANVMTGEQAQEARVRARRRLIGAMVLLGLGVIAFPLLFETQPRPIPVDIPIVIPPRDGAAPLALPAPKPAATPAPTPTPMPAPVAAASAPPPLPAVEVAPSAPVPAPAPPKPAVVAAPAPKPPVETAKPAATVPKPAATEAAPKPVAELPKPVAPSPSPAGRFVVQIGAFAEAAAVRDVRSKAQKAGVATFTQVVDTNDGKRTRVRVGPFASREEAEKAAAQVKAAGLPGSVMAL
jgi:DedD protein